MIPEVYSAPTTGAEVVILMALAIGAVLVALLLALAIQRIVYWIADLFRRRN